jgi:hypothetical protein
VLFRFAVELGDWEALPLDVQRAILWDVVAGIIRDNFERMAREPVPPLYESGVRFIPEAQPFVENCWHNCSRVLELGGSHCVGLTAWRVAELRMQGEDAKPAILDFEEEVPGTGETLLEYHFVVLREDGTLECPSTELGMP